MDWRDYIHADADVLLGKPAIRGTRLSVEHILGLLAQGWSEQQVLDNHPRLTHQALQAVYAYLYDCMQDGILVSSFKKAG